MEKEKIDKQFIPHQEALYLKELGFDESCFGLFYQDELELFKECKWEYRTNSGYVEEFKELFITCTAPLWQQAFDWFRKKYNLLGMPTNINNPIIGKYGYDIHELPSGIIYLWNNKHKQFDTYEKAELACLQKLIELAKKKEIK